MGRLTQAFHTSVRFSHGNILPRESIKSLRITNYFVQITCARVQGIFALLTEPLLCLDVSNLLVSYVPYFAQLSNSFSSYVNLSLRFSMSFEKQMAEMSCI